MKILLLGSNGQVGWELRRSLAPLGLVTALGREDTDGLCGDLTRPDAIALSIRQLAPDVIVNAAAYTSVDEGEIEAELAQVVNAHALSVLAAGAREFGAWLIHYSTDYVFDGKGDRPWQEDDPTGALNVYGRTKRDGELEVQKSGCRYMIFRTSWVYSPRGKNFIRTILRLAATRDTLQVVDNQYGAPTGAELVADVTAHALRAARCGMDSGVYHLAAAGETTWYRYARFVIAEARAAGWPVTVSDNAIDAVTAKSAQVKVPRPNNSRLNCGKLETAFNLRMPDWRDGVRRALMEILACNGQGEI